MAWDGSGNFVRTNGTNTGGTLWQDDRDDGVNIRADRHDVHDEDIAQGLENTVALDGQNTTQDDGALLKYESASNAFIKAGEVATTAEAQNGTAEKFPDAAGVVQSIYRNAPWMWEQSATYVDSDTLTTDTTTTDDAGEYVFKVGSRVQVYLQGSDAYRWGTIIRIGSRAASANVHIHFDTGSLVNESLTIWPALGGSAAQDGSIFPVIRSDLTLNIPTDHATLQDAIDTWKYYRVARGVTITLNIESGHDLTAGLRVEDGDYSHFVITSVDATVSLDAGFSAVSNNDLGADVPRSASIGFVAIRAFMPTWDFVVDTSTVNLATGYELDYGSRGVVLPNKGVTNTTNGGSGGANCRVTSTSSLQAAQSTFTGGNGNNVAVTLSAAANLQSATLTGATNGACLDVSRGSYVHVKDADLSGGGAEGIYCRRSRVSAEGVDVSNCATGITASHGASSVGAPGAVFDGCTQDVKVEAGGIIDVSGATKSSAALDPEDSVIARAGSTESLRQFNVLYAGGGIVFNDEVDTEEETITGTADLSTTIPVSKLDSSGGAVTGTLPTRTLFTPKGFIKTIVMTDATNSSTVSVTDHETSDPEVFTFSSVGDTVVLLWTDTEWITLKTSGATT